MRIGIIVTRGLLGAMGVVQVALGVLLWTGHALGSVPLHMAIGAGFVLALWVLAVLCARAGAPVGLVVIAVAWGAFLLAFGVTQTRILPGPAHGVIRAAHLLTGIVAMGLGAALTARTRRPEQATAAEARAVGGLGRRVGTR